MDSSEKADYLWTFVAAGSGGGGSGGASPEELPRSEYRRSGQDSVLSYVVRTDADYGRIECRATNSLGTSAQPCTFTIQREGEDSARLYKQINETKRDVLPPITWV